MLATKSKSKSKKPEPSREEKLKLGAKVGTKKKTDGLEYEEVDATPIKYGSGAGGYAGMVAAGLTHGHEATVDAEKLDKLFKPASELTKQDDLEFEIGRLRTKLETRIHEVVHDGQLFLIECDPLNDKVRILDEWPEQK